MAELDEHSELARMLLLFDGETFLLELLYSSMAKQVGVLADMKRHKILQQIVLSANVQEALRGPLKGM